MEVSIALQYFAPLVLLWLAPMRRKRAVDASHRLSKTRAHEDGLTEPASLHPTIDASICVGCGSCLNACPEQLEHNVLGLIDGKAELVYAADCIGHGACRAACPVDAIQLVFGTERRGVEIPDVQPNFETNVPGLFIGGELGGMGLIRNAMLQGLEVIDVIAGRTAANGDPAILDVAIVGAGPAGFSASLAAHERGLKFVTLEQDSLGGAISHYPRGKVTMTHGKELPFIGRLKSKQLSKEALLRLFSDAERATGVHIRYGERMHDVSKADDGFVVSTNRGTYRARNVLLAIGRRGTPRKLNVPGEVLPKVVYRLIDPAQYDGHNVMVVGGGDSAIEAAAAIAAHPDSNVVLVHRAARFDRAKSGNRERLRQLESEQRIRVLRSAKIKSIGTASAIVEAADTTEHIRNDAVIVCVGGEPPMPLLQKIGVRVLVKHGAA